MIPSIVWAIGVLAFVVLLGLSFRTRRQIRERDGEIDALLTQNESAMQRLDVSLERALQALRSEPPSEKREAAEDNSRTGEHRVPAKRAATALPMTSMATGLWRQRTGGSHMAHGTSPRVGLAELAAALNSSKVAYLGTELYAELIKEWTSKNVYLQGSQRQAEYLRWFDRPWLEPQRADDSTEVSREVEPKPTRGRKLVNC